MSSGLLFFCKLNKYGKQWGLKSYIKTSLEISVLPPEFSTDKRWVLCTNTLFNQKMTFLLFNKEKNPTNGTSLYPLDIQNKPSHIQDCPYEFWPQETGEQWYSPAYQLCSFSAKYRQIYHQTLWWEWVSQWEYLSSLSWIKFSRMHEMGCS